MSEWKLEYLNVLSLAHTQNQEELFVGVFYALA